MIKVRDFYDAIDSFAPFSTAESWDNSGLLIGDGELPVARALLVLDLTAPVLEEAVKLGADLIITHHPAIFKPLSQITGGSVIYRAVKAGISVISAHTNLDLAVGGVNDALAARLGLSALRPLRPETPRPWYKVAVFVPAGSAEAVYRAMSEAGAGRLGKYSHCAFLANGEGRFLPREGAHPAVGSVGRLESVKETRVEMICPPGALDTVLRAMRAAHPYEEPGYDVFEDHAVKDSLSLGRLGELKTPLPPGAFASLVKDRLGAAGIRYVQGRESISAVAVCGGSGAELLRHAIGAGAQALVTGEGKHHLWLEAADAGLTLVDAGHFATENVVIEPLRDKLSVLLPGADLVISRRCTDGVQFL